MSTKRYKGGGSGSHNPFLFYLLLYVDGSAIDHFPHNGIPTCDRPIQFGRLIILDSHSPRPRLYQRLMPIPRVQDHGNSNITEILGKTILFIPLPLPPPPPPPEATSATPETVIPETPPKTISWASLLGCIRKMGNIALTLFGPMPIQATLPLQDHPKAPPKIPKEATTHHGTLD